MEDEEPEETEQVEQKKEEAPEKEGSKIYVAKTAQSASAGPAPSARRKKKKDNIIVSIKTDFKQSAAGEYIITGLHIDSPKAVKPTEEHKASEDDEDEPKAEKKPEEPVPAEEAEKKPKKKAKKQSNSIARKKIAMTKEEKRAKEKQELEELDKILAEMKGKA